MKKVNYNGVECAIYKAKYSNNNTALILLAEGYYITKFTINEGEPLPEDLAYIKDYSENKGALEFLQKEGIVVEILDRVQMGYVVVPLVKLNLDGITSAYDL